MKGKPFTFLWTEGGKDKGFEAPFGIGGSGYPATMCITTKKTSFSVLRKAFSSTNL